MSKTIERLREDLEKAKTANARLMKDRTEKLLEIALLEKENQRLQTENKKLQNAVNKGGCK